MAMRPSAATSAIIVVALALFTDTVLYYAVVPLLPGLAKQHDLGPLGVGVLVGSYAWSLLLLTAPLARVADRAGRRGPLLAGLVGLAATTLLFAFADRYWVLVVARVLQGAAATVTWTAGLALLSDHFDAARRPAAMAVTFTVANAGTLLGPPLAGALSERWGPRAPFVAVAGVAALDALARVLLVRDAPGAPAEPLGWRAMLADPSVRLLAGAMAAGAAVLGLLEATLPVRLAETMRLSPAQIGLAFGVMAVGHLGTSPLVTAFAHRVGRGTVIAAGLFVTMLLLPCAMYLERPWPVVGVVGGLGVALSLVIAPVSPALADVVEARGSASFAGVFGLLNIAFAAGMLAGPYLGSAAVAVLGPEPAFVLAALACGGYGLVVRRARSNIASPRGKGAPP